MKKLEDVGNVIAERELELADGRTVQVVIGQPQLFPEGGSFYCPIRITGIGKEKIMHAGGVDSVQALLLAMQMISANLYTSDEGRAGTLTWLGKRNLGLPVAAPIQDLVPKDGE
ncbi:MAG: hypothetical protein O7F69_11460 [Alphaproteobacteria bacterium]|nr:hypothetical protein [Alphaproteobacteria bacterium]MCZ6846506.1 hypothetical protein [Alphaproteobacteria bacterium]